MTNPTNPNNLSKIASETPIPDFNPRKNNNKYNRKYSNYNSNREARVRKILYLRKLTIAEFAVPPLEESQGKTGGFD